MSNFIKLVVSVIICQLAGIIGLIFISDYAISWYETLNKPSFIPPSWLFGLVWIFLYFLMGIALFLIWKEGLKNKEVKKAFVIFIVQLILNIAWYIIFFGIYSPIGGLIVIIILWVLILITILKFIKISKLAGIMLMPYLIWVTYTAALNFFIYISN